MGLKSASELIEDMSKNLDRLFMNLEIQDDKTEITVIQSRFIQLLEDMIARFSITKNVDLMNEKLKKAVKKTEDLKLEVWNCKKESTEINTCNRQLTAKNQQLKVEIEETKNYTDQLKNKIVEMENKLKEYELQRERDAKVHKKESMEKVMAVISIRDSIIMRQGLAEDENNEILLRLLNSLAKETAMQLKKMGVATIEDLGKFDPTKHMVTDVIPTDDEKLHNIVAKVFRPGYMWGDEMVRPEEVILYSYKINQRGSELNEP